jgi:tetratricopeptide (TPR) repeat protein
MQQRSLFPDHFELHAQALAALRTLDTGQALALVRRAMAIDARLVDIQPLERALTWLHRHQDGTSGAARAAALLTGVRAAVAAGELDAVAAHFADEGIVRSLGIHRPGADFLDAERTVPWALLDLIENRGTAAREALSDLLADAAHRDSARLWAWLGDACRLLGRNDEAETAYGKALLLHPEAIDWWRLRHLDLAACWQRTRALAGSRAAGRAFVAAWLEGLITVPPDNSWFTADDIAALTDAAEGTPAANGGDEARFAILLYLDRTTARHPVDVDRRDRMATLHPELFAQFVAACRAREEGARS